MSRRDMGDMDQSNTPNGEDMDNQEVEQLDGGLSDDFAAEDSTGINSDDERPIDPSMPNMPPA